MRILKMTESGRILETLYRIPTNDSFNQNVLIVGASGSGKSYLSAILKTERKPKITMIFKEDRTYESSKVLRVSDLRIPPDLDKSAFISAFTEALDINQIGIMASAIPSILAKNYGTAKQMKRRLKLNTEKQKGLEAELQRFVLSQMELFYPDNKKKKLENLTDRIRATVLSLDELSQQEQIYFADYILRILQKTISGEGILIDEIHRLKNLNQTIISEIVREIRHKGYVIAVTQSLSDLPEALINNFGTIFHFNSIHFTDLGNLARLDSEIPATISQLQPRQFVEIRRFQGEWKKKFKFIYEAVNE